MEAYTILNMIAPFASRDAAAYWGGGVLAEAVDGGWYSLHGCSTPSAPELYAVGRDGRMDGWPPARYLRQRYVWATSDDGSGTARVCLYTE